MSLTTFVQTLQEYMFWHGYNISQRSPIIYGALRWSDTIPADLHSFHSRRAMCDASIEDAISTYGPGVINCIIPNWTWSELGDVLIRMPFPSACKFSYDPALPGRLYAEEKKVLVDLFSCGEYNEQVTKVNPLERSSRDLFERRAANYLSSLISQLVYLSNTSSSHTTAGDSIPNGTPV